MCAHVWACVSMHTQIYNKLVGMIIIKSCRIRKYWPLLNMTQKTIILLHNTHCTVPKVDVFLRFCRLAKNRENYGSQKFSELLIRYYDWILRESRMRAKLFPRNLYAYVICKNFVT